MASSSSPSSSSAVDHLSEGEAAAVLSALPTGHSLVSVDREVKVVERSVLTVNGTNVSLESDDGREISAAMMAGRMPNQEVINRILMKAGIIVKPAKK
jgi:isoaspartyl peptidase/L-asparaginase-like protein (Ntn-hydrolase superfamily)